MYQQINLKYIKNWKVKWTLRTLYAQYTPACSLSVCLLIELAIQCVYSQINYFLLLLQGGLRKYYYAFFYKCTKSVQKCTIIQRSDSFHLLHSLQLLLNYYHIKRQLLTHLFSKCSASHSHIKQKIQSFLRVANRSYCTFGFICMYCMSHRLFGQASRDS